MPLAYPLEFIEGMPIFFSTIINCGIQDRLVSISYLVYHIVVDLEEHHYNRHIVVEEARCRVSKNSNLVQKRGRTWEYP